MRSSAFLRLEVLDRQQDGGTEHQRPADACHAIGFIPHSIGMIAGDIDHGNAKARRALIELWQSQHHAPHAIMPTQRGEHWLWFCTLPARRARWAWEYAGCAGDVLHARALCRIHNLADLETLVRARAERERLARESSFPAHLLSPAPRGARATRTIAAARLADVHTGNRNETLFLRLRQWARSAVRGCTHRGEFDAMVLERACAISASFPCEPEPDAAVRATAYSVARYAWERRHQRDYSAECQHRFESVVIPPV